MKLKGTPRRHVRLEYVMRPAVSVTPDTPGRAALRILLENRIPGMPIVDAERHLVGFVSDGHLLASVVPRYMVAMQDYMAAMEDLSFVREGTDTWMRDLAESANRPVSEVMSSEVPRVELGRSEVAVAHKMVHDGPPASWSQRTASLSVS